jgi:ABC-type dipeptide/oligopeptide/nickel transport system permease component
MIHHLLRRLALGLVTLVLISFVVYGLIRSIPGTPLTVAVAHSESEARGESEPRALAVPPPPSGPLLAV